MLSRSNNSSHGAQGLGTILRRGFAVTRLQLRINVIANSHCAYQRPTSSSYRVSTNLYSNDVSKHSYRLNIIHKDGCSFLVPQVPKFSFELSNNWNFRIEKRMYYTEGDGFASGNIAAVYSSKCKSRLM